MDTGYCRKTVETWFVGLNSQGRFKALNNVTSLPFDAEACNAILVFVILPSGKDFLFK